MAALISYRNLADTAVLTASTMAGFSVDNLKTRQLSTRWQMATPDGAARMLTIDLGSVQVVRLIALLACERIAAGGNVRLSQDGATWSSAVMAGEVDLGVSGLPYNMLLVLEAGVEARFVELQLSRSNPEHTTAGAGRLWVGDALVVPYGADSDWEIKTRERGSVDESAGLEVYASSKPRGRELRMSFSGLDESLAFGTPEDGGATVADVPSFQDLHTHVGAIGEVIAMPRTNWIWPRRLGIYGRLGDDSLSIRHDAGPNYTTSVRVIEER